MEEGAGWEEAPTIELLSPGPGSELTPGDQLGPYRIEGLLGAGGMGRVYRARDPRLARAVALKVLNPDRIGAEGVARFQQEARAVAALNHPNILTIFDIGTERGSPYVVTELLEGRTLRERLRGGPLSVEVVSKLADQALSGLEAAHSKGILHRDLKPENLFQTTEGCLKILDFGLAKQIERSAARATGGESALTQAGVVVGTLGYGPPEQLRGEDLDPSCDLFALGAVLYELLTGRRAFAGETPIAILDRVLNGEAPDLQGGRPELAASWIDAIHACLRKRASERPQSAVELRRRLLGASPRSSESTRARERCVDDGRARGSGQEVTAPTSPETFDSIAVLPFRNLSSTADHDLGLGLADATISELATSRVVLVRPTSAILPYRERNLATDEIGRRLAVDAVVEGSFQKAGSRIRITVQLVATNTGQPVWGHKVVAGLEDLFAMQDEVSEELAQALRTELAPWAGEERKRKAPEPEAYQLFLLARPHLLHETLEGYGRAADLLERASRADPGFAPSWAALAEVCGRIGFNFEPEARWYDRAWEACSKALALEPRLPEGLYARAYLQWSPKGGWDHAGAIRNCSAAVEAKPGFAAGHLRLGVLLYHVGLADLAMPYLEKARTVDPGSSQARYHIGFCRYHQGDFVGALVASEEVAALAPSPWVLYQTALCHLRLGRLEAAAAVGDALAESDPGQSLLHPLLALLSALRGDMETATAEIGATYAHRRDYGHYHHAQYEVATALALLGEHEKALRWLTQAVNNGYPCAEFLRRDPLLESLGERPRFLRLVADAEAEAAQCRALLPAGGI
jgi:serine/threonine protein kinase